MIAFARVLALAFFVLGSLAGTAAAQTTVSEPPDFSNSIPGPEIELGVGTNTVSGSVQTPDDGQDNFRVTVPTGAELTAVSLTLDTSGDFSGSVTWNLTEVRESSGDFTMGLPAGPGPYQLQVVTDFATGNSWSLSFTVEGAEPECGNGVEEAGEECDDGNTIECDGCSSSCETVIDGCFIDGACVAEGTTEPGNECRACRPAMSRTDYSPVDEGTECDDGLFCTQDDECNGLGTCTGTTRDCSDGLECTTDACDEGGDTCVNPLTTGCLIEGACVGAGETDPADECQACDPDASTSSYSPIDGCGTDAGMADAGSADGGTIEPGDGGPIDGGGDGGSHTGDASIPSDAAPADAGGDAGSGSGDGCGCSIGPRPLQSHTLLALGAIALAGILLRRRG